MDLYNSAALSGSGTFFSFLFFWGGGIYNSWVEKQDKIFLLIPGIKPRPSSQQQATTLTEVHQLCKYTRSSFEIVIDVGIETGDSFHKGSVI